MRFLFRPLRHRGFACSRFDPSHRRINEESSTGAVVVEINLDPLGIDFNVLAGVDFRSLRSVSIGGTNLTVGPVPAPEFDNALSATSTDFAGAVPPGGVSFGLITNNVPLLSRALEETTGEGGL